MKPLYIFLLLWAVFITGLADGISWALLPIPGLGIVLAFAITFCINATMGVGLLFLLITNGMYHPKFGPVGTIAGLVPPFNFLPVWIGLVAAGIVHDLGNEKGAIGEVAKLADDLKSNKNPLSRARAVSDTFTNISRRAEGRPPRAEENNEPQENEREQKPHSLAPKMASDIAPRNQLHANPA